MMKVILSLGFPGGSVVKNLLANAGDVGSIPGSDRTPEEGNAPHPSTAFLPGKSHRLSRSHRGNWWPTADRAMKESNTT